MSRIKHIFTFSVRLSGRFFFKNTVLTKNLKFLVIYLNLASHHKSGYREVCPWCPGQWERGSFPEWPPSELTLPAGLVASCWPLPEAPLSPGWSDGPPAWECWGPAGALWWAETTYGFWVGYRWITLFTRTSKSSQMHSLQLADTVPTVHP